MNISLGVKAAGT